MGPNISTATQQHAPADFGPQGGDPRRAAAGIRLDLSTCVNRYGPPQAAMAALQALAPVDLLIHPYEAARQVEHAYAALLGVEAGELVAGRGTTEFIWALARNVAHDRVAVPLPAYTDYLRAFPGRGFAGSRPAVVPTLRLMDEAMRAAGAAGTAGAAGGLVILSNPHNPTGVVLDPEGLLEVAARHPHCTLVVDESYVDFLLHPDASTVIGSNAANVVALRSPSKFYGIAATRAGVAWSPNQGLLTALLGSRETWPVSGLDAAVAVAALESTAWAERSRRQLADDGCWHGERLAAAGLDVVEDGVHVHYRCVVTDEADALAARFARHGLGVRPLSAAHGVDPGAVRILAPRRTERPWVAHSIAATAGAGILERCG